MDAITGYWRNVCCTEKSEAATQMMMCVDGSCLSLYLSVHKINWHLLRIIAKRFAVW